MRARARLEVAETGATAALEASRAAADDAERRYGALALARGVARDTVPVDLARVRAHLDARQALVSIVTVDKTVQHPARVIAFAAVGPTGALSRIDLGPARDVSAAIAAWRVSLGTPPAAARRRELERDCRRRGATVRSRTWDLIAPRLGSVETVMLVADGELADLPWQALPSEGNRYLVDESIEIHTLGAERELLTTPRRDGRGLLALGDPDYDRSQDAAPTTLVAAATPTLPGESATPGSPTSHAQPSIVSLMRGAQGVCGGGTMRLAPLPGARAEVEEIGARLERRPRVRAGDAAGRWRGVGGRVQGERVGARGAASRDPRHRARSGVPARV